MWHATGPKTDFKQILFKGLSFWLTDSRAGALFRFFKDRYNFAIGEIQGAKLISGPAFSHVSPFHIYYYGSLEKGETS